MFLGIDVGTSSVKAVIVSEAGSVLGQATTALTVSRLAPLWSEQDPEAWWEAADSRFGRGDGDPQQSGPEPRSGRQEWLENLVNRF